MSQEDAHEGTSGTIFRLGEAFSCLCRHVRCSNQKFINVAEGAKLAQTSVLRELKAIHSRKKLLNNRTRGSQDDIRYQ